MTVVEFERWVRYFSDYFAPLPPTHDWWGVPSKTRNEILLIVNSKQKDKQW